MSNFSLSQTTNTLNTNSKCLDDTQLAEVYRGLKQGDYLKQRVKKTEEVLDNANEMISQQKINISKQEEIIKGKDSMINTLQYQITQEKEISDAQKEQLNNTIKALEIQARQNGRKKFWNGIKIGGISVAILGTATFLLLNK